MCVIYNVSRLATRAACMKDASWDAKDFFMRSRASSLLRISMALTHRGFVWGGPVRGRLVVSSYILS